MSRSRHRMPEPTSNDRDPDPDDAAGESGAPGGERPEWWPTAFAPLPRAFQSDETGEPFSECIDCGRELLHDGTAYLVQKCSNGRETVFEFALCLVCAERLHASYSEASKKAMHAFFASRVRPAERAARLIGRAESERQAPDAADWTRECLTCGRAPDSGEAFALAALCDGADLVLGHAPYLICGTCELALNELISPETRGEWDRFIGRNFDLPPTLENLPKGGGLIVV